MKKTSHIIISSDSITIDGVGLDTRYSGQEMLKEIYHSRICNYPKFHKMDILCQLAFVATELLLQTEGMERFVENYDRAVLIFGKSASIYADRQYQKTICDRDTFFPSPSVFVYTLPNIASGEIALRNHYHGETSYIAVENKSQMESHINVFTSTSKNISSIIGGWVDARNKDNFEAEMWIIK